MQPRLPGLVTPIQVRPDSNRREPGLWMRRICLLRELKAGDEYLIREIKLRRGLNIVWAPGQPVSDDNRLFQSGFAGHTAGKTTFCRLVRYILGQHSFATEGIRKGIREKFPSGWVVAEVLVDGRSWAVARPFGIGPRSFCFDGGTIEQTLDASSRLDFQFFTDALTRMTMEGLPGGRFPTTDELIGWPHILPWLTRDQECRFADFLEWRHTSSDSETPSLSLDERQFLVRSVLGLITDQERTEQKKNAALVADKRTAVKEQGLLSRQAETDHARIQILLDTKLAPPSSGLFGSEARTELERRRADLNKRMSYFDSSDRRPELQLKLEKLIESETNARRDLDDAATRVAHERFALEQLTSSVEGESTVSLLASLPPPRDYCNTPMSLARQYGCPIARSHPIEIAERQSERLAAEELEILKVVVRTLQANVEENRAALSAAEKATEHARLTFQSVSAAYDQERAQLIDERARLKQIEKLVLDAEEAWRRSEEQSATVQRMSAEIEASYIQQDQHRRRGREGLGRFSATFDYVVRAFLGDEVQARIDTSGRSISLIIEHEGNRDSSALATVKLLAFDLAALTASIEGSGHFPRFLLHDSPREADMAADTYHRLFLYARQLEDCFESEPSFQYIVTTTTRPPDDFLNDPWICLKLAGTPSVNRLFRVDL